MTWEWFLLISLSYGDWELAQEDGQSIVYIEKTDNKENDNKENVSAESLRITWSLGQTYGPIS